MTNHSLRQTDRAWMLPTCRNTVFANWMFTIAFRLLLFMLMAISACQQPATNPQPADLLQAPWEQIEQSAKGSTVRMMMWQGDPLINRFMSEWVVPEVKKRHDINLEVAPWEVGEIPKIFMAEIEANQQFSSLDIGWINGENFFQVKKINALFGPFAKRLPNAQFIDFQNPFIGIDFQQPVDGYECPWGNVQQCIIYDTLRTPQPPRTLVELEQYVQAHPGKFTIPFEFTGMTLLKAWMIALAGDPKALNGPFDEAKYAQLSGQLFEYINRIKVHFWRKGETFPDRLALMHQMFANDELDFTMSNNDNEVDNKIIQGIFPSTASAYVFTTGTIQNSHYLAIPQRARNQAGAMVVINFLISPEAQLQKLNPAVWGDGTVLNLAALPTEWQQQFAALPNRKNAPLRANIQPFALQEPDPEYMIRLFADFKEKVIIND
jgi:putative spermidine/putrescine transport system substrate-binding protein